MEFDYNFSNCVVCQKKMLIDDKYEITRTCPSDCCKYKIDPQGETVIVTFRDKKWFIIELYKDALLHWHPVRPQDYKRQEKLNEQMDLFLSYVEKVKKGI